MEDTLATIAARFSLETFSLSYLRWIKSEVCDVIMASLEQL